MNRPLDFMTLTMSNNMTQAASSGGRMIEGIKILLYSLVSICFSLFLFFITLILHLFVTVPHLREHARYILFVHMLINDTLYLFSGFFLMMTTNVLHLPFPICYSFISLGATTFKITPHNLAAMALERYVAICFPLRHLTLWTPQRSYYAIALIWFIDFIPNIIDFLIIYTSVDKKFFSLSNFCNLQLITVNVLQSLLRSGFLIANLVSVGLAIAFTYIRVMCVAKNMSSGNGSAQKAGKTVMLHAGQFLLCLFSLTYSFLEAQFRNNIYLPTLNFLFFMCLPRLLSPIIYGLRDQWLMKCIRNLQPAKH